MKQAIKHLLFYVLLFSFITTYSIPLYICTGACKNYFHHLINLIGSLHKTNYANLKEIAVFDLGMEQWQLEQLKKIRKVSIHRLKKTNPDMLTYFHIPNTHKDILGWYAWKPVIIKQALEKFPYVLWLDAGSTVLKPLDSLFTYLVEQGYFLCTIGDDLRDGDHCLHTVGWGTTSYVFNKFELYKPENQWILTQESIMGGVIGVTQTHQHLFLDDLYELSKDLKNYEDDGTGPHGFGTGRHDQTVMSILAYSRGLTVLKQDYTQTHPIYLPLHNKTARLHITWHPQFVSSKTTIYSSRSDMRYGDQHKRAIHYRKRK